VHNPAASRQRPPNCRLRYRVRIATVPDVVMVCGTVAGNPNCTVRGHDPSAVSGTNRHHSAGSINELVAIMKMQPDHASCRIVVGEGGDLGVEI